MSLKELRAGKGMNQTELSKALSEFGLKASFRTVQNWEADSKNIPYKKAVKIAQYFGVSPEDLYNEPIIVENPEGSKDKYIARLEEISAKSEYSREEQKKHIHEIKMRTSTLSDSEKVELLLNELLIYEQKLMNQQEMFETPVYKEFLEMVKNKFKR